MEHETVTEQGKDQSKTLPEQQTMAMGGWTMPTGSPEMDAKSGVQRGGEQMQ